MKPIELAQKTLIGHAPGPRLLITGGVHGDEFEPMAAVRRLLREIDPQRLRGTITIVPVVTNRRFARRTHGRRRKRPCPHVPRA